MKIKAYNMHEPEHLLSKFYNCFEFFTLQNLSFQKKALIIQQDHLII